MQRIIESLQIVTEDLKFLVFHDNIVDMWKFVKAG